MIDFNLDTDGRTYVIKNNDKMFKGSAVYDKIKADVFIDWVNGLRTEMPKLYDHNETTGYGKLNITRYENWKTETMNKLLQDEENNNV